MTDRWIEAEKAMMMHPEAQVYCPACEESTLRVISVNLYRYDTPVVERHMVCDQCGAYRGLS